MWLPLEWVSLFLDFIHCCNMTDSSLLWKQMGKTTVSFLIFLVQMSVSLTYCLFFPESITGYFGVSVLWCWNHHPRYRCKHCLLCQSFLWCSQGCLATASLSCACQVLTQVPALGTRWGEGTTVLGFERKFYVFLSLPTAPTLWERATYWRRWHHPDPF